MVKDKKTLTISSNLKEIDTSNIHPQVKNLFLKKKPFRGNKNQSKFGSATNVNFNPELKRKTLKKIYWTTSYKEFIKKDNKPGEKVNLN